MSETLSRLADRAAELRLAFDSAFAEDVRHDSAPTEDLLALRVGSEPYALRLSDIGGLFADRKITALPGGVAALLGFAGFRGSIAPVYDLHVLLGRPPAETPRWLATAAAAPVAFAFEDFEGHLRVPRDAVLPQQTDKQSGRLILEFVSTDGLARPIVHMPAVIEAIRRLLPRPNGREER